MMACWLVLAIVAASWQTLDGCSCQWEHPQTLFCKADFVVVGRVQKMFKGNEYYRSYKIKIRNIFKATPKARAVLQNGRILTPIYDSQCGIQLQPKDTYVLTGRIIHAQAQVNLCDFYSKWREVTPRQRKGFRLLYQQGCTCKVHMNRFSSISPNSCLGQRNMCYEKHGICLHGEYRRCRWTRAPVLKRCLQQAAANKTMTTTT
ncbi:tissue inhibitor of metalloproteinase [Hyposmocoma kahamanoa]|uniref:tissue inhibitor of metalloproteinase n=1 Tax=Hyposmocoma kahamanoa TaxID=1477025 RepID=UPI000E6D78F9|nr:tissue inhibitor of metalloproteinase [Hyposmocoma kahamanoa]XP_026328296.1 tissue inhibitor of metalloproteinase [Hyposmocoma kahamanoa]